MKLEKLWPHVFTATITLTDADGWYRKIKELIDKQQAAPVWMAETKVSRTEISHSQFRQVVGLLRSKKLITINVRKLN